MVRKIRHLDKKEAIRQELLRCARAGETIFYSELGNRVGIPPQGPWKPILDVISRETAAGDPDITFLVINKQTGLPGQIGFEPAKTPTLEQGRQAERELQRIFDYYARC